ncbi:hypothetical protein VPH35_037541 [Triticum aestivum]
MQYAGELLAVGATRVCGSFFVFCPSRWSQPWPIYFVGLAAAHTHTPCPGYLFVAGCIAKQLGSSHGGVLSCSALRWRPWCTLIASHHCSVKARAVITTTSPPGSTPSCLLLRVQCTPCRIAVCHPISRSRCCPRRRRRRHQRLAVQWLRASSAGCSSLQLGWVIRAIHSDLRGRWAYSSLACGSSVSVCATLQCGCLCHAFYLLHCHRALVCSSFGFHDLACSMLLGKNAQTSICLFIVQFTFIIFDTKN